jgi:hypothetical protein
LPEARCFCWAQPLFASCFTANAKRKGFHYSRLTDKIADKGVALFDMLDGNERGSLVRLMKTKGMIVERHG